MLKRLSSAISTAHAISLAIREAPDAIRECVEFARKNSSSLNELEATRKALESVDATCCKWRVKYDELKAKLAETERALAEMNGMYDEQCKATVVARENTETVAATALKERAHYEGRVEGIVREIASLRVRVAGLVDERDSAVELVKLTGTVYDEAKAKLARHEAAEQWHQVTAGEGELPPEGVKVFYQYNHPNYPIGARVIGEPGKCGTYRWRYLSSEDVPQ